MERPASIDEIASDRSAAFDSALQSDLGQSAIRHAAELRIGRRISERQVAGRQRLSAIVRPAQPVVDGQPDLLASRRSAGAVGEHAELFVSQMVQEGPEEEPDLRGCSGKRVPNEVPEEFLDVSLSTVKIRPFPISV